MANRISHFALGAASRRPLLRARVLLCAATLDALLTWTLHRLGLRVETGHWIGFLASVGVSFGMSRRGGRDTDCVRTGRVGLILISAFVAFAVRGAPLTAAILSDGWKSAVSIAVAGLLSAVAFQASCSILSQKRTSSRAWWAGRPATLIVALAFIVRALYAGVVELVPEEAYYWNYSLHPDIGYFDHPPMVAWLIWAGTHLLGSNEFAVRLPALLCSIVAVGFCAGLTRNLRGARAGRAALALFSLLPCFFTLGFMITPDAGLVAAWAGTLYFLERALLGNRRTAWWGVGVCLGLGLLSKYTILLLVPTTVAFAILDAPSRRWLRRPEPYAALVVAGLLFLPVIVWNMRHAWASFAFQTERRLQDDTAGFYLPILLTQIVLLLTPAGAAAAAILIGRGWRSFLPARRGAANAIPRSTRFMVIFTALPLGIFVVVSLRHEVKINWTSPVWLAALPAFAAALVAAPSTMKGWSLRRIWRWSCVAVAGIAPLCLIYLSLGLPFVPVPRNLRLPVGWRELAALVENLEVAEETRTGVEPLIVGMDTNFLGSEMAFYDPSGEGSGETAGSGLFGRKDLMYSYWFPIHRQKGKTIIAISRNESALDLDRFVHRSDRTGDIMPLDVYRRGELIARFHYRFAYGFHPPPSEKIN